MIRELLVALGVFCSCSVVLAQSSIVPDSELLVHPPIPVLAVDPIEDDHTSSGTAHNADSSALWGRNTPKIVRSGQYYYTVLPTALHVVTSSGEKRYHRDITLYQRHQSDTEWSQVWTESWSSVADGGFGTRRAFQPPTILVNNTHATYSETDLHVIFTGIDNISNHANQTYKLRHFVFDIDESDGSLVSSTPTEDTTINNLGDKFTRWGGCATRNHMYLYLVAARYGNASPPNESVEFLRYKPGAGTPWQVRAGNIAGNYFTSSVDLVKYAAVEGFGQDAWAIGSVEELDTDANGTDLYREVHLYRWDTYGDSLLWDQRIENSGSATETFGQDFVVVDHGSTYSIYVLCVNLHGTGKNYLYAYSDGALSPTLVSRYEVPGLLGNNASMYYDEDCDAIYIFGDDNNRLAVWRTYDNGANWSLDAAPVADPVEILGWPLNKRKFEYAQVLKQRYGGTHPADGIHLLVTYELEDWICTYNVYDHGSFETGVVNSPGRLMQNATGSWQYTLDLVPLPCP